MSHRNLYCLVLALLAVAALATSTGNRVPAQESANKGADLTVLKFVPDDALMAIVTPRIGNLDAKLSTVSGLLKMPTPGLLQSAQGIFGLREGLDLDRSAALVLVSGADGRTNDSVGVGFLPISDYDKLIGQFSPQATEHGISRLKVPGTPGFLIARKDEYAVFVGPTDDERTLLERVIRRPLGVPNSIAPLANWIGQQDVAFIVTTAGVKWGVWQAPAALKSVLDNVPGPQAALGSLQVIGIALLPEIERAVAQFGIGLQIEADGSTRVTSQARFFRSSAASGSGVSPPSAPQLSGLPASPYLVAFDMPGGNEPVAFGAGFASGVMKATGGLAATTVGPGNGDKVRALEKAHALEVKSSAQMLGPLQRDQPAFSNSYYVLHVEDSAAYLKNYAEFLIEYKSLEKSSNDTIGVQYDVKNIQVNGAPALEVTMTFPQAKEAPQQPGSQQQRPNPVAQAMIGTTGKITALLAASDPKTVVVAWGDPGHLRTAVTAAKTATASLVENADVKVTANMLAKDAQWTVILNIPAAFEFAEATTQITLPQSQIHFPRFPATPPLGISLRVSEGQFDTQIALPRALLTAFGTHYQQMHGAAR